MKNKNKKRPPSEISNKVKTVAKWSAISVLATSEFFSAMSKIKWG